MEEDSLSYLDKFQMFAFDDVTVLFVAIIFMAVLSVLVLEIIYFVPSLINSYVRSIRNKSIVEQEDILESSLNIFTFISDWKEKLWRK